MAAKHFESKNGAILISYIAVIATSVDRVDVYVEGMEKSQVVW